MVLSAKSLFKIRVIQKKDRQPADACKPSSVLLRFAKRSFEEMAIHLGQVLPPGSCGLPSCRPGVIRHSSLAEDTGELGRATRKADRLALLRVEIAAFHVAPHLAAQSYSSLWL